MYELEILKIGFILGYMFLWFILAIMCLLYYIIQERKVNIYLRETKQIQRFVDYKHKTRFKWRIVREK